MPPDNTPPRKSGRFSQGHSGAPQGLPSQRRKDQKPPEYYDTAFGKRQYGNAPQKGDEPPRTPKKRYRDMTPAEQRTVRMSAVVTVVSLVAGFVLCGLLLRLFFA